MIALEEATAIEGRGIEGDRVCLGPGGGKRQVTLIQSEHLPVIAALSGHAGIGPEATRRNLVVSGINLAALRTMRFAVGAEVILEGTGVCAPCSKMDETLGEGGFQAMRGHGGITARVVRGGVLRPGDTVRALGAAENEADAAGLAAT